MAFSLVLCGRFASGGLTIIALISSIKIATGIATGRIKTDWDLEGTVRAGDPRQENDIVCNLERRGDDYLTTTENAESFPAAKSIRTYLKIV